MTTLRKERVGFPSEALPSDGLSRFVRMGAWAAMVSGLALVASMLLAWLVVPYERLVPTDAYVTSAYSISSGLRLLGLVLLVWGLIGKWGQEQRKAVTDPRLRRVVEECRDLPGYEVFKYLDGTGGVRDVKSHDLNAYVKEVVGPRYTAKDFRTWAGTLIAASTLAGLGAS